MITTHVQDEYIQAISSFIDQLDQNGLLIAKEMREDGKEPFIYILKPNNSLEITSSDVQDITEIAQHTMTVFERRGGIPGTRFSWYMTVV